MLVHVLEGFDMKKYVRAYDSYDVDAVSNETGLECKDVSRTVQAGAEESDINYIVKQYGLTGKVPQNLRTPSYGDFDYVGDYQSALEAVRAADEAFLKLDARVRLRFDNDPQKFLEFCADSGNLEEMRSLGLAIPVPVPEPPGEV